MGQTCKPIGFTCGSLKLRKKYTIYVSSLGEWKNQGDIIRRRFLFLCRPLSPNFLLFFLCLVKTIFLTWKIDRFAKSPFNLFLCVCVRDIWDSETWNSGIQAFTCMQFLNHTRIERERKIREEDHVPLNFGFHTGSNLGAAEREWERERKWERE